MEKYLIEYGFGSNAKEINEWKSLGEVEGGTPYDAVLAIYNEKSDELLHAIFRVIHKDRYVYFSFG